MKTQQEIFDTAALGLLNQGEKSVNEFMCLYRTTTPDGRTIKCAAGHLIADEHYSPNFEGTIVTPTIDSLDLGNDRVRLLCRALDAGGVPRTDEAYSLVCALQRIHDSRAFIEWPAYLRVLARDYNLSAAAVDAWKAAQEGK